MEEKAIVLSRVSSLKQDLVQQTDEVLKQVRNDGFKDENIIIIEDKESAIKLSEEERRGLNEMKRVINSDPSVKYVYIYELSRLSRKQLVLFSIRDFLVEKKIQLICLKPYFELLDCDGKMSLTEVHCHTFPTVLAFLLIKFCVVGNGHILCVVFCFLSCLNFLSMSVPLKIVCFHRYLKV